MKTPSVNKLQAKISDLELTIGGQRQRIVDLECALKNTQKILQETTVVNEQYVSIVGRENSDLRNTIRTMVSVLAVNVQSKVQPMVAMVSGGDFIAPKTSAQR